MVDKAKRGTAGGATAGKGFVVVAFALSVFAVLGVTGLAVDLGRMYVVRSEAQSFADAAALNGVLYLAAHPGDNAGTVTAATSTPKLVQFSTKAPDQVTVDIGDYSGTPPVFTASAGGSFVRVTASANVAVYLMQVVTGSATGHVSASAIAGKQLTDSFPSGGEFPFSPLSRAAAQFHPDDMSDMFGYKIGNQYTLRYGSNQYATNCGTDNSNYASQVWGSGSMRGYCCTLSDISSAILYGATFPIANGSLVSDIAQQTGQKTSDLADAMNTRVNSDSDPNAPSYKNYHGSGKRLVTVAVNDGTKVVGFAEFFLLKNYSGTPAATASFCAEYVGQMVQGQPGLPGGAGSGVYHVRLYQ